LKYKQGGGEYPAPWLVQMASLTGPTVAGGPDARFHHAVGTPPHPTFVRDVMAKDG